MALGGGRNFRKQLASRLIRAATLNRPIAAAEEMTRWAHAPGIHSIQAGGIPLERVIRRGKIQANITGGGTGGIYSWRGEYGYPGHYTNLPSNISGTTSADPAIEINANASITTGTHVVLERDYYTGKLLFQYDSC